MASDDALDRLLHQVQHWVPAHCGSKRRLSVAFNAAVLLPDRRWPDGALSRALPNLEATLATARADLEQRTTGTPTTMYRTCMSCGRCK